MTVGSSVKIVWSISVFFLSFSSSSFLFFLAIFFFLLLFSFPYTKEFLNNDPELSLICVKTFEWKRIPKHWARSEPDQITNFLMVKNSWKLNQRCTSPNCALFSGAEFVNHEPEVSLTWTWRHSSRGIPETVFPGCPCSHTPNPATAHPAAGSAGLLCCEIGPEKRKYECIHKLHCNVANSLLRQVRRIRTRWCKFFKLWSASHN